MYDIKYDTTHHDGLTFYTFTNPVNGSKKSGISTKVARTFLAEHGIEEEDDYTAVETAITLYKEKEEKKDD